MKKAQRPTVQRLMRLLEDTPVKVQERVKVGGKSVRGYYDDGNDIIVVSRTMHPDRADGMVATVIHELLHKWYDVDHEDDRVNHQHVWPGEMDFFKSRPLRERVQRRLLNSGLYGMRVEWRGEVVRAKTVAEYREAVSESQPAADQVAPTLEDPSKSGLDNPA